MQKIWCEPAECWTGCDDPGCPYTHWPSWHREGDPNGYVSQAEAEAAVNPHPVMETRVAQR